MTTLVSVVSAVTLLASCGSSTVDNAEDSNATGQTIPSVSASKTTKNTAAASADISGRELSSAEPQDGSIKEVDGIPSTAERTQEDKDFLESLTKKGVDFSDNKEVQKTGGLEDQVVAAGNAHCQLRDKDIEDVFIPMAAGQIVEQGLFDGTPQELEGILIDAAKSAYCE